MALTAKMIKQAVKQLLYLFPAHALVFVLTWYGIGPSPIPILTLFNLPIIYILVRKSPTLINIPLLIALTVGAAMAHNEPTTSPMESYFENFSILSIIGSSIAFVTLAPMIITKYITIKVNHRFQNFTHNVNSRLLFPVIWTAAWSLFRRYSPLGSWGDWSYTIENSGYTGDPLTQIASIGGLSAINLFLALWMQVISDFLILRHRINKVTRESVNDETTPLINVEQPSNTNARDIINVYKEDLTKNYYLRMGMLLAILSFFIVGSLRLNHFESNLNHIETEKVGCVLTSHNSTIEEMLSKSTTMVTNLQTKIVLWSESAISLRDRSEYEHLLDRAYNVTTKYKFYLGFTYIVPDGHKKKNMLTLVGPNNQTVFEYQKTHPVPLVESYSIESGPGQLTVANIELPKKKGEKGEQKHVSVSGAICLDMDFPELLGQAASAYLVLSPAQTWSTHVGLQHLKMSSVRSIENGYWILRCDGNGASGLIDPYGRIRHVQIASNDHINMFDWEIPIAEEKIETYYATYGESTVWGAFILLGICRLAWYFSWQHFEEDMDTLAHSTQEFIDNRQKWIEDQYDEIFDREELETPLAIQNLI